MSSISERRLRPTAGVLRSSSMERYKAVGHHHDDNNDNGSNHSNGRRHNRERSPTLMVPIAPVKDDGRHWYRDDRSGRSNGRQRNINGRDNRERERAKERSPPPYSYNGYDTAHYNNNGHHAGDDDRSNSWTTSYVHDSRSSIDDRSHREAVYGGHWGKTRLDDDVTDRRRNR
jgi:hypothetical protein